MQRQWRSPREAVRARETKLQCAPAGDGDMSSRGTNAHLIFAALGRRVLDDIGVRLLHHAEAADNARARSGEALDGVGRAGRAIRWRIRHRDLGLHRQRSVLRVRDRLRRSRTTGARLIECARVMTPGAYLVLADQFSAWLAPTLLGSRSGKARTKARAERLIVSAGLHDVKWHDLNALIIRAATATK
jgi:hypothetical protein